MASESLRAQTSFVNQQRLIFTGKELEYYSIQKGSTIYLVLRRGCGDNFSQLKFALRQICQTRDVR